MKWIINIIKFVFVFLITIEILSQVMGYQKDNRIYALGSYPFMKTPSLKYWKNIYDKLENDTISYYQYDSMTGWSLRPHSISPDGYYHINGQGIRGDKIYKKQPSKDTIRIALLGNSAIFSAEVPDTNTLGVYLEAALQKKGYAVEVINFGVGGYGNDQVLLRWENKAKDFKPDVVIHGVMVWDFGINLNIFRYCVSPQTGIMFTKPRAIVEKDSLKWVNYPTVPINEVYDSIVIGFEERDFFEHEYFSERKRYGVNVLDNLYLYKVLEDLLDDSKAGIDKNLQGRALMKKLVDDFQKSVESENAQYLMFKLSSFDELSKIRFLKKEPHSLFWKDYEDGRPIYSNFELMMKEDLFRYFAPSQKHYSAYGNQVSAKELADYLIENNYLRKKEASTTINN